jgi:hypothetical protein
MLQPTRSRGAGTGRMPAGPCADGTCLRQRGSVTKAARPPAAGRRRALPGRFLAGLAGVLGGWSPKCRRTLRVWIEMRRHPAAATRVHGILAGLRRRRPPGRAVASWIETEFGLDRDGDGWWASQIFGTTVPRAEYGRPPAPPPTAAPATATIGLEVAGSVHLANALHARRYRPGTPGRIHGRRTGRAPSTCATGNRRTRSE